MTPTTLVMAYYENPSMLAMQFNSLRVLPVELRDLLHVVIVDDGSPTHRAIPEDLCGIPLQVYRLRKDVRWNQDACRNIGVAHAETSWVLMTDMDHMVPEMTWRAVLLRDRDPEHVYQFARVSAPEMNPYKLHPNSWFMTKKMFDRIGGYDERFAGFYGTDGDFKDRVVKNASKIKMFKEPIIRVPRTLVPDASTTSYLRKQPEDTPGIIKVKQERARDKDWKPLRGTFEYDLVTA